MCPRDIIELRADYLNLGFDAKSMNMTRIQQKNFSRNVKALKRYHPAVHKIVSEHKGQLVGELFYTRKGLMNLRYHDVQGVQANLSDSPEEEVGICTKFINADIFSLMVCVGFGMGWVPMALKKLRIGQKVVVIEPWIDNFYTALFGHDFTKLFSNPDILMSVGECSESELASMFYSVGIAGDIHVLEHEPSIQCKPNIYDPVRKQLNSVLTHFVTCNNTMLAFADLFFKNRFKNLEIMDRCRHTAFLKDKFANIPAILVAAGPSLSKEIDHLKRAYETGKILLLSVDAALPVLLKHDIEPHFVSSIDPQPIVIEKFSSISRPLENTRFLFNLKVTPYVMRRMKFRQLVVAVENHFADQWIWKSQRIEQDSFLKGNLASVAHLNLSTAIYMGCNPVVFLGQDLCMWEGTSDHAEGVVITGKNFVNRPGVKEARSVKGEKVYTDDAWLAQKYSLEAMISGAPEATFINTSLGLPIRGADWKSFSSVMPSIIDIKGTSGSVNAFLDDVFTHEKTMFDLHGFVNVVHPLQEQIDETEKIIESLLQDIAALKHLRNDNTGNEKEGKGLRRKILDSITRIEDHYKLWEVVSERLAKDSIYKAYDYRNQIKTLNDVEKYLSDIQKRYKHRQKIIQELKDALASVLSHISINREGGPDLARIITRYLKDGFFAAISDMSDGKATYDNEINTEQLLLLAQVAEGNIDFLKENSDRIDRNFFRQYLDVLLEPWIEIIRTNPYRPAMKNNIERLLLLQDVDEQYVKNRVVLLWNEIGDRIYDIPLEDRGSVRYWEPFEHFLPWECQRLKAKVLFEIGQFEECLPFAQSVADNRDADVGDMDLAVRIFLQNGQFDVALELLEKVVVCNASSGIIWEEIGDMLVESEDYEGALIAYEKCINALPERYETFQKLGETYQRMGNLEAAKFAFEVALQKVPAN